MKRFKALAASVLAVACAVCALAALTGCQQQQQSYTPPEPTPQVSKSALAEEGVLRVGVDTSKAPLAGTVSDKIVGIDVDVAAALADELGLKLDVVDVADGGQSALANGDVDILMGVGASTNLGSTCWTSDPYLTTSVALFASLDNTAVPAATDAPTIAAQTSSLSAWAVANVFEDADLRAVGDLKEAFADLESGDIDYVAADAVVGSYVASTADAEERVVALLQEKSGYRIALLDGNQELKRAVADALATIEGTGIVPTIELKWLGTELDLTDVPLIEGTGEKKDAKADEPAASKTEGDAAATDSKAATDGEAAADGEATLA